MNNYFLREKLDNAPGGCGMRSNEVIEKIRKTSVPALMREIIKNTQDDDPILRDATIRTACCDLLALLTELDLANQLQEEPAFYVYKAGHQTTADNNNESQL